MSLANTAQRFQALDQLVPLRMRLPLRYHVQRVLGALEPEMALLPGLIGSVRGRTAVDIGANLGIYTYALARQGVSVHAFEPQPACCAVIAAWAGPRRDIAIHNVGLADEVGELTLRTPLISQKAVPTRASFLNDEHDCISSSVKVITLDSANLTDVAFIKIDVEGFEMSVLRGATSLLATYTPVLLVEIDRTRHDQGSFGEITGLLDSFGYRMYYCEEGQLVECTGTAWHAPTRFYNFIFKV